MHSSAADVQGKPRCKLESGVQINSFMAALLCQKLSRNEDGTYLIFNRANVLPGSALFSKVNLIKALNRPVCSYLAN